MFIGLNLLVTLINERIRPRRYNPVILNTLIQLLFVSGTVLIGSNEYPHFLLYSRYISIKMQITLFNFYFDLDVYSEIFRFDLSRIYSICDSEMVGFKKYERYKEFHENVKLR